jgi:hypothetical protein
VVVESIFRPHLPIDHDKGTTIFLCQTIHQIGGIILIMEGLILKRGGRAADGEGMVRLISNGLPKLR